MRRAFVLAFCLAAFCCQPTTTLAADDSQHGETVLALNQAPADAPARRHPKALWFELSNLRKENGRPPFGGEIALDFRREEGKSVGWHDVVLVVKSSNGRREYRSIGPSPFAKEQGTVRGSSWFGPFHDGLGDNLEVWLEQNQNIAGTQVRMKVSHSITLGNVGQITYARHWTPNEQKAFDSWEKSTTPPPAPPAGYQLAGAETTLVPGMPILAGWMAAWQPAEVIEARTDGSVLVKYSGATTQLVIRPRNWISVELKILESARTNPAQFKPSVKVLPGGTAPIPADLVAITAETPLVKGTPAKADWAGRWNDVTILEVHAGGKVRIHWDGYGSNWDEDRDRSTLLIAQSTLDALKKPDAAEKFAKNAERLAPGAFGARSSFGESAFTRNLHQYPISIPIPKTAARVTEETPLEEGTKLGCSWGSRWYDVTVLAVHDDGSVRIRWDEFSTGWDGDLSRDCLIIDKKVLAKLESKAKKTPALRPVSPGESSGGDQFKVVLKGFGTSKIAVIKAVMDATSLDLKDAKEFVESTPVTLKQNLTKVAAEKLRTDLQAAGATVAIELQ